MTKVWEIMSKGITTVESNKTAASAAKKMADLGIGCLLVTRNGNVIGIITERDLIKKVLAKSLDPKEVSVENIMSQPLITVEPSTELGDVSKLMSEKGIKKLPVMDRGAPVGILTTTDIANYLANVHLYAIS
jgi:CBS domain-containing protein